MTILVSSLRSAHLRFCFVFKTILPLRNVQSLKQQHDTKILPFSSCFARILILKLKQKQNKQPPPHHHHPRFLIITLIRSLRFSVFKRTPTLYIYFGYLDLHFVKRHGACTVTHKKRKDKTITITSVITDLFLK